VEQVAFLDEIVASSQLRASLDLFSGGMAGSCSPPRIRTDGQASRSDRWFAGSANRYSPCHTRVSACVVFSIAYLLSGELDNMLISCPDQFEISPVKN
jgi:hypothetical protein